MSYRFIPLLGVHMTVLFWMLMLHDPVQAVDVPLAGQIQVINDDGDPEWIDTITCGPGEIPPCFKVIWINPPELQAELSKLERRIAVLEARWHDSPYFNDEGFYIPPGCVDLGNGGYGCTTIDGKLGVSPNHPFYRDDGIVLGTMP